MFSKLYSRNVEPVKETTETKSERERELEGRAHNLARLTHVLEWQAEGINPDMGRRKSPHESP